MLNLGLFIFLISISFVLVFNSISSFLKDNHDKSDESIDKDFYGNLKKSDLVNDKKSFF